MLSKYLFRKISCVQRRFMADTKGAVAIYVTIMLPVLLGVGVLTVDASRLYNLQSLLQKGADSLALAGAAELDRLPTAIIRSNDAINNLVQNQHKFSVGGLSNITVSQVRFLSGLPANDSAAIDASFVTTDPTLARFVEVTVTPANLNTILPASFIGGANVATARASAVASFDSAVCNFTPVFICNPFENDPSGMTIQQAAASPEMRRRMIELRQHGGSESQYFPGIYGFLDPDNGNSGANALRDMIGDSSPPACFIKNGVTLRPGFIATARDAFNVRFDMYEGPMAGKNSNSQFRPAMNVRKGYSVNSCNQSQGALPDYQGLPRDNCFASGTCPHMGGRMGDGNWDVQSYWSVNHGGTPPFTGTPSRYEAYRYEIDNDLTSSASPGGETGAPQCYAGDTAALSDEPDRRVLYGAVLNCQQLEAEYGISGGSGGPYPVEAWAKFFITEPVETGQDSNIHVELVGILSPGTDAGLEDIVQLNR